jgi:TPR repeat protein
MSALYLSAAENSIDKEMDSCHNGSGMACFFVAASYMEGKYINKDISKGIEYLEKACEQGAAVGCYNLGNIYAQGRGVDKMPKKAMKLFNRACDKGVENACYNYKVMEKRMQHNNNSQ